MITLQGKGKEFSEIAEEKAGTLMEFNLEEQTLFNMSKKGKKQIHEIINEQTEQEGK